MPNFNNGYVQQISDYVVTQDQYFPTSIPVIPAQIFNGYAPGPADTRLVLDGTAGTYASTPDHSPPTDVDIMVCVALADWDPTANLDENFVGQTGAWRFWRGQDGFLEFLVSGDGTAVDAVASTTKVPASDGAAIWVRIRHTDAGDNDFLYAPYQEDEPAAWVNLTLNRTTTTPAIFDSTSPIEVGARAAGTADPVKGQIYRVIVKSAGVAVLDMDPRDWQGGTSWVSSRTGETWTLNGAAVVQPKLQLAGAQVWGVRAA